MSENLSALSGRKGLEDNLFEQLVEKSKVTGSPDNEELKALAEKYLMGDAITYGTASFYDFMKKEHEGVKVHVCNGSACLVAGTQDSVKGKLSRHFKDEEVGHMCCLGRCHENSAFNYNGTNYSGDAINDLETIIEKKDKDLSDTYAVGATGERVLTGAAMTAEQFKEEFSKILANGPEWALKQIKASNIRGRGGAGFPMSFKLNACRNEAEPQKYIVCNADEGDPGAYSDRYLLEEQPMLVLFGMMTAGYIVGADHGAVYIRGEYPESVKACADAVKALEAIGMHGDNIGGTDFSYRFKVIEGAGAYICGEETALLSSLEGQRPEVRVRPPFPAQKGLFNKPTIVNNVETLAAVPWIIRNGGDQYAKLGTEKSTGTKLVCLDSFFNKPGMYEVEMGHSFKSLVYETGGGFKEPVKAVHVGGPLGGIVPTHKIDDLNIDFESFANGGFLLGHAGIVSVPEKFPMIEYLEHLFEFTADESCGKCFPCSIGSVRGKEMIANSRNGEKMDRQLMDDLLETLEIGSLCALGGGLPLGIKNALEYFEEELRSYFL
ncbi:NADH-ubiquinone oxidoreductase-F iron-sulfur binding region domain-containing protein [Roseivirga sp. E12]|uniref:(2Fe-2S) ferredoxin domain-containing protein n=1 Tax=Roseivirga sp. E12 TaxID=2819237 RepID=UPI001ABD3124|nr:NADH-ubiquinone oxidoreductase-F iron-sulfur binding region domain-containing protein [Roseivirga sp. E12]MBO3697587.1 NAD(P)H-dependent oxidoreductase subunit E [Roseivirga sp. E12]